MTDPDVISGLRVWARGVYATEAAVELLARSFGGQFADRAQPWIRHRPGGFLLDVDGMTDYSRGLADGHRQVLAVVEALASRRPLADLPNLLAGLDRPNLALILAAFSHTAGAHQDYFARRDRRTASYHRPGPLVAWPEDQPPA